MEATILDWGLAEKPVIVTGASSGIGAATARALGSVGAACPAARSRPPEPGNPDRVTRPGSSRRGWPGHGRRPCHQPGRHLPDHRPPGRRLPDRPVLARRATGRLLAAIVVVARGQRLSPGPGWCWAGTRCPPGTPPCRPRARRGLQTGRSRCYRSCSHPSLVTPFLAPRRAGAPVPGTSRAATPLAGTLTSASAPDPPSDPAAAPPRRSCPGGACVKGSRPGSLEPHRPCRLPRRPPVSPAAPSGIA